MKIQVNGEIWQIERRTTVAQVLLRLNPGDGPVALTVNDNVVPAAERDALILQEGDRVEVFAFAGGG